MSNPFAPLQDALRVLVTQASVLPATGQAVIVSSARRPFLMDTGE